MMERSRYPQHGARFQTESCTRGCHWIPCMFASSEHACDQWHSSRESTALTVVTMNYVQTLKAVTISLVEVYRIKVEGARIGSVTTDARCSWGFN
jgi:hypothetical protein